MTFHVGLIKTNAKLNIFDTTPTKVRFGLRIAILTQKCTFGSKTVKMWILYPEGVFLAFPIPKKVILALVLIRSARYVHASVISNRKIQLLHSKRRKSAFRMLFRVLGTGKRFSGPTVTHGLPDAQTLLKPRPNWLFLDPKQQQDGFWGKVHFLWPGNAFQVQKFTFWSRVALFHQKM